MNKWLVAVTVMLPTLIEIIDTSVVNVSLNHIRGSLSAGIDEATWAITSYLVSNAIVIPLTGWLSRFWGRKRYLIYSVALFTLSSFFCGAAWSLTALIVFRVLQGIGGGALQPLSQAILLETFPKEQHGTAMAIFGVGIMFGPIVGPLLGGWITDNWSWHWIFFINIPIGVVSILLVLFVIVDPPYMTKMRMKIDYWGLVFLTLGLGCLQIVLDKGERQDWFSSDFITWLALVSAVSLVLFVIVEVLSAQPIVNFKTFRNATFSTGNVLMFFAFFNLFATIVLVPIYLQTLMGYTATLAGLVLGPGGMATLVSMPLAGRLINKVNPKYLLGFGILVCAYAVHLMQQFNLQADFDAIIWPRIVLGMGLGFLFIPLTTTTMSSVPNEEMGNASAIFNLLRNLGGSFGVAFVTTLLSRRAQFHQSRLVENITPFDRMYQESLNALQHGPLSGAGAATPQGAEGTIYGELLRQASMMSFNDAFHILTVLMVCLLPLVLLMKVTKSKTGSDTE